MKRRLFIPAMGWTDLFFLGAGFEGAGLEASGFAAAGLADADFFSGTAIHLPPGCR
jgi:hypothetical protein